MAYEEHKVFGSVLTWLIIIVSSVIIVGWGMFIMMGIMSMHERHWDFGIVPDAPSESVYSTTFENKGKEVPKQIIYPK